MKGHRYLHLCFSEGLTSTWRLKIPLLFLAALSLVCPGGIYGQTIRGAAIAGFNVTQVDGDEVFGYRKFGWNLGATAIVPVKNNFFIGIETLYNQKGSYQKPIYSDSVSGEYRLLLNYAEIPLLLMYEDKETMTFGAGVSWGRLVDVKEYEHGIRKAGTTLKGPYKRSDWDILLDVRFQIYKRLKFNFRYAYSLARIRTRTFSNGVDDWQRKQFNNVITFRLLYVFNEKIKPISKIK